MILFWPVATKAPEVITAPAIMAVALQMPKPPTVMAMTSSPRMIGTPVLRGTVAYH